MDKNWNVEEQHGILTLEAHHYSNGGFGVVLDGVEAVSVAQFCNMTSLSKTSAFKLIKEKRLAVVRVGRRTLILMGSVRALLGGGTSRDS